MFQRTSATILSLATILLSVPFANYAQSQDLTSINQDHTTITQGITSATNLDLGELLNDFTPVSQPEVIQKEHRDVFGSVSHFEAIQLIVQAKHFVTPLGYFAYFYDQNGVEVGFVPVENNPAGSIQPGAKMYITIPTGLLLNQEAQVQRIVVKKL